MKRVGILGGTFDPIHFGHLRAAEVVRQVAKLDRVLFVPAAAPPHKASPDVSPAEHRVRMVELALEPIPYFQLSKMELERDGPSYTIDTMSRLRDEGAGELFFVTGSDAFVEIRTWMEWRRLLEEFSFVILDRPGATLASVREVVPDDLRSRVHPAGSKLPEDRVILLTKEPMLDISSTAIRSSVREERSVRFLVPDVVEGYIRINRLYM